MFTHAESPSAQNFHPEFGYFCPTPRMRRNFRSAVITILAGLAIAVGAALALSPQLAPQSEAARQFATPQVDPAMAVAAAPLAAAPLNVADRPAGLAQETVPATAMPAAPATRQLAAGGAGISCDDLANSFLAPRCQLGKAGKSRLAHTARAAGARAAALSTGAADAGPQPTTAAAAEPAVMANEATAAQPAEPSVPAKKPVKTAHKPMPSREVATAEAAPPAPAPATGSGLFGLLHAPTRTGGGAWAMSW
jgi:hypothetical protein